MYLYNKNWETRVAAGEALAYLADIFEHHIPDDLRRQALACGVSEEVLTQAEGLDTPLTFSNFSLQHVLERGTPLGASGGQVCRLCEGSHDGSPLVDVSNPNPRAIRAGHLPMCVQRCFIVRMKL